MFHLHTPLAEIVRAVQAVSELLLVHDLGLNAVEIDEFVRFVLPKAA